mmetsp:Transcript_8383/g.10351  ORF Transcript_8383/g.10351 Transcript_8383/m.10351 type:complete len:116 (-) Transcript_8383:323-670(-)
MLLEQELSAKECFRTTTIEGAKCGRHRVTTFKGLPNPSLIGLKRMAKIALDWAIKATKGEVTAEFVVSALENLEAFVERWDAVLLHYTRSERKKIREIRPYWRWTLWALYIYGSC